MLSLPSPPETPNVRVLAAWKSEEFTGLTTDTLTLSVNADAASGMLFVWLNGTLVRPSLVTVTGADVTLPAPLIVGDWVAVLYKARGS